MKNIKGRRPRMFIKQFAMLTYAQKVDCEWRTFDMICARTIKTVRKKY